MNTNNAVRIAGLLSMIGGIGLITWWFLMPIFLPISDAVANFKNLVLNTNWIPVNIIGLISMLLLTLGFPGFYLKNSERFCKLGFTGLIIASIGLILYTSIQYYETIIWPAAAQTNPELVQVKGALVSGDSTVVAGLLVSGVFLSIGYILFGIFALQTKTFSKIPVWLLIVGTPLFGVGVAFIIRTVGILMFGIGTIWLANNIRKNQNITAHNKK